MFIQIGLLPKTCIVSILQRIKICNSINEKNPSVKIPSHSLKNTAPLYFEDVQH